MTPKLRQSPYSMPKHNLSEPEWPRVAQEAQGRDAPLAGVPDGASQGYGCTWFCDRFAAYQSRANPTFRHRYAAGAATQTDYAGPTVEVIDPQTGEIRQA
jgi:hypothetical protein